MTTVSEGYQVLNGSKVSRHPLPVHLAENVKNERLSVEVEGFVVEEQLGQEAEVPACTE